MESLSQAKHLKMLVLKGDYIATDTMLALADALGTNRTLEGLVLLRAFQHIFVGVNRSRSKKLSSGLMSCQLSLALTVGLSSEPQS